MMGSRRENPLQLY